MCFDCNIYILFKKQALERLLKVIGIQIYIYIFVRSCTLDETSNGKPWCAYETQRDGNAVPNKWEDCDSSGKLI